MYKTIILISISILLSACSDYPTTGKLLNDSGSSKWRGDVSFNKFSGFVVEVDSTAVENISEIKHALNTYTKTLGNEVVIVKELPLLSAGVIDDINNMHRNSLIEQDKSIEKTLIKWNKSLGVELSKFNEELSKI